MRPPAEPARTLESDVEASVRRQLTTGLLKIGLAIRHHAWAGGEELGLTPTQGQILALLLQREARETRIGDVAGDLAVTQPTASVAVRALVQKGLVEKARVASDARANGLVLTPAGRDVALRSVGWAEFLLEAVDELDDAEQAVFQRSIVKMIRGMQVRGQIPVARMCVSCQHFRPHAHPGESRPHHCAFVDAAIGDRHLRLDCADFEPLPSDKADLLWRAFAGASASAES